LVARLFDSPAEVVLLAMLSFILYTPATGSEVPILKTREFAVEGGSTTNHTKFNG